MKRNKELLWIKPVSLVNEPIKPTPFFPFFDAINCTAIFFTNIFWLVFFLILVDMFPIFFPSGLSRHWDGIDLSSSRESNRCWQHSLCGESIRFSCIVFSFLSYIGLMDALLPDPIRLLHHREQGVAVKRKWQERGSIRPTFFVVGARPSRDWDRGFKL